MAFIQGKVADGILTSDETAEIIEELQSHMKRASQRKKIVVKEETEEDLANVQGYLVEYLSDGEDEEEPSLVTLEEMDFTKEGALETTSNCLKIEQALKNLDTKYFKGQVGLGLGLLKISEDNLEKKREESGALESMNSRKYSKSPV